MVDTTALGEERSRFLTEHLNPILHDLVTDIICHQPQEPLTFMSQWLHNRLGKPSDFVIDESKLKTIVRSDKINALRNENAKLRNELEQLGARLAEKSEFLEKDKKDEEEEEDDDDDDVVDEMPPPPVSKGPRSSVSAEAYGAWNKKTNFTPPVYQKTDDQTSRLSATLGKSFLFSACDEDAKKVLIGAMEEVNAKAGEKVIKQGDDGDFLFVIEAGVLECWKKFPDKDDEIMVKTVNAGDVFGELALLYNTTRAASVVCKEDCVLWKLDRQTFNAIVKDASQAKRDKFEKILNQVPLLAGMDSYERSQLADALKEITFKQGDMIITQGEDGDRFYLIEKGTATAIKDGNEVMNYKPGDYFGELALLYNQARAASIRADSDCKMIYLSRSSFSKMLGPLVSILTRDVGKYH